MEIRSKSATLTCRPVLCGLAGLLLLAAGSVAEAQFDIVPQPATIVDKPGAFLLSSGAIFYTDPVFQSECDLLRNLLQGGTGFPLPVTADVGVAKVRLLSGIPAQAGDEAYDVEVTPTEITMRAATPVGMFRAIQTLLQLLPAAVMGDSDSPSSWTVPCVTIHDAPRFRWRGVMLDCSRTFQSVDSLKATIDRMACYKLNVLHLHLTDDQGWRIEIKAFPELTGKGAQFPERYNEPPHRQGFYTREQLVGLVAYAAARHITIVPEIEMPGHTLALLSVMPELSCTGGPFEIFPFFEGPNITEDIFCAGNERTFLVLEKILSEIVEIFPSEFVHIGGDEVPKTRWKACGRCQQRIRDEGLKDEAELQSWFIRRASTMLADKGRRLIGWDEILEGGLAPGAAVMSWRGTAGGIAAATAGHDVVLSPSRHCYFDYDYRTINSRRVYEFDPLKGFHSAASRRVLGVQANFWSHIDREPELVDRQLFPRLLALAERGWSLENRGTFTDFKRRALAQLPRLRALGVNYHTSDLPEHEGEWAFRGFLDETRVGSKCWVFKNSTAPVAPIATSGEFTNLTPVSLMLNGHPDLIISDARHAALSGYEWTGDPDKTARDAFSNGSGIYSTSTMTVKVPETIAMEGEYYHVEILAMAHPDPASPDRRFNVTANGEIRARNWRVFSAGNYNSVLEFDVLADAGGITMTFEKGIAAGVDTNPYIHAIAITPLPSSATVYSAWAQQKITDRNAAMSQAFDDDADADGVTNGLEWALGGDPLSPDAADLIKNEIHGDRLMMSFNRVKHLVGRVELGVEWDPERTGGMVYCIPISGEIPLKIDEPSVLINSTSEKEQITVSIPAAKATGGRVVARLRADIE